MLITNEEARRLAAQPESELTAVERGRLHMWLDIAAEHDEVEFYDS